MTAPVYTTIDAYELARLVGLDDVTKTATGVSAACPEHTGQSGATPPLRVDNGTHGVVAHCFGCGYSAGALGLIQSTQQDISTPADAARWLEQHIGTTPRPRPRPSAAITPPPPPRPLTALDDADADKMLDSYASALCVPADHLRVLGVTPGLAGTQRVLRVPARDQHGVTVGWQDVGDTPTGQHTKRTKLSAKGLPAPVWGMDDLSADTRVVVLCEGVSDYLIADAAMGTAPTITVIGAAGALLMRKAAQRAAEVLATLGVTDAALCVSADGDKAGIDAAVNAGAVWTTPRVTILIPDKDCDLKDIHLANTSQVGTADKALGVLRRSVTDAIPADGAAVAPLVAAHLSADANHVTFASHIADVWAQKWAEHADAATDAVTTESSGGLLASLAEVASNAIDPDTGDPYDLWQPSFDEHGRLALLHHHATALLLAPVALLGMVLVEHASTVAHNWVLPPRTGNATTGAGSPLVLYVCLAAPPGSGKTEAAKQAKAIIDHSVHTRDTTSVVEGYHEADSYWPTQRSGTPTSGEALAEQMTGDIEEQLPDDHPDAGKPHKIRKAVRHRARWHYGELDQLLITASRSNSILLTMLRQAWSGEELATTNATAERSRRVPELTYSMGISALAQFEPAGELLTSTARGDAQRWLWLPNSAPYSAAAETAAADAAKANGGTLPLIPLTHWSLPDFHAYDGAQVPITVDASVTRHIVAVGRSTLHGTTVPDDVAAQDAITGADTNKHTNQMRIRLAVAVARLCGLPPAVTPELWRWAGALLSIDRQTRELLVAEGERTSAQTRDQQRQARTADRQHATDAQHDKTVERIEQLVGAAAHSIASYADRHDRTVTAGQANRALAGSQRAEAKALGVARTELRDLAIDLLLDEAYLTVSTTNADHYQLTDAGHAKLHE